MCTRKCGWYSLYILTTLIFVFTITAEAQRMRHGASRSMSRPSGGGNRSSINGGSYRSTRRPTQSPSTGNISGSTRNTPSQGNVSGSTRNTPNTRDAAKVNDNSRNTNNKVTDNSRNQNNKINDNSRNSNRNSNNQVTDNSRVSNRGNTNIGNDVNINVDRSRDVNMQRNTAVAPRPIGYYPRPPYMYGGRAFFCFHPYAYHPFVPFYWGPAWHPWGFFVAALAVTAIIVAVNDEEYHYDEGVWYQEDKEKEGYTVVSAPVGGTVTKIPSDAQTVEVNNTTNYYYGGTYYEKDGQKYKVVPPPAGAVVDNLPAGGEEVKIGDQTYVKVGETYYQPVKVDGKDKYEVTQVEAEKK